VAGAALTEADRETLWQFFAGRARRASDGSLAAKAALGLIVAIGALLWAGHGWALVASIALCFTAYGSWGILDRELGERSATGSAGMTTLLRLCRALAAGIGVASAVATIFAAMALALGTWIS
jgi:hypothetical protein